MNIEEAIVKLEQIAKELEAGDLTLEQAMEKYTEGVTLVKQAGSMLSQAKLKIEEMKI